MKSSSSVLPTETGTSSVSVAIALESAESRISRLLPACGCRLIAERNIPTRSPVFSTVALTSIGSDADIVSGTDREFRIRDSGRHLFGHRIRSYSDTELHAISRQTTPNSQPGLVESQVLVIGAWKSSWPFRAPHWIRRHLGSSVGPGHTSLGRCVRFGFAAGYDRALPRR